MSSKSSIIKIALLSSILLLTGFGCKANEQLADVEHVELTYWQVWQNSFDIEPLISAYTKMYPQVTIRFKNLRFKEYEQELLKAFAEDSGPDIFSIPHSWVGLYRNIIEPAPESVQVQRIIMKEPGPGELEPTIAKIFTESTKIVSARDILRNYYPFIRNDIVEKGAEGDVVVGLPLYIDTLALYYNKDILEQNGIYDPPSTWERFQQDVIQIAKVDKNNNISLAGAAMGSGENIIRPTDILAALMIQTGVEMIDSSGTYAAFHQSVREEDAYNAGLEALRFYTDFADPSKKVYTWNADQPYALEVFKQGKLAYLFGYSYNLSDLRNSKVDFGVAPLPEPVATESISHVSIANYWLEVVSKKSANQDRAWHFLNFLSQSKNLETLQNTTGKISPLKEHLAQIKDPELGVFAAQAPQAKVWYNGKNAPAAEEAIIEMIESAVDGTRSLEQALQFGAQRVTQTLR